MRRANGSGSVFKMKDKTRRKPYRARVTVGWEINEETGRSKQVIKDLGTYATQKEAYNAIQAFLNCPYDLTAAQMTMKELFDVWWEEYRETLKGVSSERTVTNAWEYCSSIYNMKIRDVRVYHLEECIRTASRVSTRGKDRGSLKKASADTKSRIKSVFNLMFDFAYKRELVDRNYARAFDLSKDIKNQRKLDKRENVIFSKAEIETLWDNVDKVKFADMILIGIYSGWRPQELAILKVKDVDLENDVFVGGLKTVAGIGRTVPIHKDIKHLVERNYNKAIELGSQYLFNDEEGQRGSFMTYDKYRGRFNKVMKLLKLYSHHPHETRHTFYTQANRSGMDDILRDRIMGHSSESSLKSTYDHREIEDLKRAMNNVVF